MPQVWQDYKIVIFVCAIDFQCVKVEDELTVSCSAFRNGDLSTFPKLGK